MQNWISKERLLLLNLKRWSKQRKEHFPECWSLQMRRTHHVPMINNADAYWYFMHKGDEGRTWVSVRLANWERNQHRKLENVQETRNGNVRMHWNYLILEIPLTYKSMCIQWNKKCQKFLTGERYTIKRLIIKQLIE